MVTKLGQFKKLKCREGYRKNSTGKVKVWGPHNGIYWHTQQVTESLKINPHLESSQENNTKFQFNSYHFPASVNPAICFTSSGRGKQLFFFIEIFHNKWRSLITSWGCLTWNVGEVEVVSVLDESPFLLGYECLDRVGHGHRCPQPDT